MRKLAILLVIFALAVAIVPLPNTSAQDGPTGTWFGTWPYTLPPDHHLNAYASGGPLQNLGNVYREMVELSPAFYFWSTDTFGDVLAESWGFTEDNSAYEITLKEGLHWSDGDVIYADDIITTYALGRLVGWSQFTYIESVEQVDDLTVRFHFVNDEPSALAEYLILREPIVAGATYGEFAERALALFETGATSDSEEWQALLTELREYRPEVYIASGPYTYSLDDVGDAFMTLHWQPNSIYSDTVQFGELKLWAGETDATTPLVLSGEIAHSTNVYPPATVDSFIAEGLEIITVPRGYGPALLFNHARHPWDIKEVRQAVALSIDRDQNAFLTNGLSAYGTEYMSGLLDDNVTNLLSPEAVDQLDRYEFDTERAAGLMESAGFTRNADGLWADADGNTISVEWIFPQEFADFTSATLDAVEQLNEFGFDITERGMPWQEVPEEIRAGNFDLSVWSWASGSPFASRQFWNPIQRWQTDLAEDQPGLSIDLDVELNGETVNLNDLINQVNAGLDPGVARERASQVALIINDLMPYIPLNVILSAEPFNTDLIAGLDEVDESLLLNPTGTDHFIKWAIWHGTLRPAN
ncbi:MAG: ABC transporter substrate-binding protein [Chloroflexi bacterium]|nr:ABC transporter substrate-binding protein [Chloroflexota bacterium]